MDLAAPVPAFSERAVVLQLPHVGARCSAKDVRLDRQKRAVVSRWLGANPASIATARHAAFRVAVGGLPALYSLQTSSAVSRSSLASATVWGYLPCQTETTAATVGARAAVNLAWSGAKAADRFLSQGGVISKSPPSSIPIVSESPPYR